MQFPDYILEHEQRTLRWKNWNDFLQKEEKIRYKKQNKVAIICLFYSSLNNIKILSNYISKEKNRDDLDFVIINNSPNKEVHFEQEFANNNIIVLSPIANLGTDGGYGLGLEYVIHHEYEYVFIVEDDVILIDEQSFSDVYQAMNEKSVGFIYPRVNEEWIHSRHVQFACYPINFLKKCGILDPRFFTRGGDGERVPRIEETIKKFGYKRVIINKKHMHPYLKKNNRNAWRIYFGWRNMLWSAKKSRRISIQTFITLFMYMRQGFSQLLFEKSGSVLIALFYALKDFLFSPRTLRLSLERMSTLSKVKMPIPSPIKEMHIHSNDLSFHTKGLYVSAGFSPSDLYTIQGSKRVWDFFKKGVIVPNINSPLYPIFMRSKKVVAINEFNLQEHTVDIYILQNQYSVKIIKSIISLLLSMLFFVIVFVLVFGKLLYYNISHLFYYFIFKGKN